MNCEIKTIPRFDKDVKRLRKKFPSIKKDLQILVNILCSKPDSGTKLGEGIYKIRLPNTSIPTGKRGGFRVITYILGTDTIYLMTIYSKTEQDSVLTEKLKQIAQKEILSRSKNNNP